MNHLFFSKKKVRLFLYPWCCPCNFVHAFKLELIRPLRLDPCQGQIPIMTIQYLIQEILTSTDLDLRALPPTSFLVFRLIIVFTLVILLTLLIFFFMVFVGGCGSYYYENRQMLNRVIFSVILEYQMNGWRNLRFKSYKHAAFR